MTSTDEPIVVRRTPAVITVLTAPDESLMSLELIQATDRNEMTISGGMLHVGVDEEGRGVIYQVIGWQERPPGLIVRRVKP